MLKQFEVIHDAGIKRSERNQKMRILTISKDMARIKFDQQFGDIYMFRGAKEINNDEK